MAINIANLENAAELLKDKDFLDKFIACETADAVIALYAENGVTVTSEEIAAIGTILQSAKDGDDELPDEIAEQIAGGADGDSSSSTKKKGLLSGPRDMMGALEELLDGITSPLNKIFKLFGINVEL